MKSVKFQYVLDYSKASGHLGKKTNEGIQWFLECFHGNTKFLLSRKIYRSNYMKYHKTGVNYITFCVRSFLVEFIFSEVWMSISESGFEVITAVAQAHSTYEARTAIWVE